MNDEIKAALIKEFETERKAGSFDHWHIDMVAGYFYQFFHKHFNCAEIEAILEEAEKAMK